MGFLIFVLLLLTRGERRQTMYGALTESLHKYKMFSVFSRLKVQSSHTSSFGWYCSGEVCASL